MLDYCLHAGSENVVIYFRDNVYIIKTLKEFQYIDEEGKDQGANVRQKAKDITNLLQDEGRLREERRSRAHMRDRMIRGGGASPTDEDEDASRRRRGPPPNGRGKDRDEDELRKAIEESKRSLAEEQAKKGALTAEERDLQQAIKLSEEEEARRRNAVDDSNASALFDDHNQAEAPNNNPFPFIDPTPYATGLQPQFTQMQPQFTSFNPYQQQAQQEAMQADYLRQQQEWMAQQQAAQAQAQLQAQQEEWMRQQQMLQFQQQQQMQPQQQLQPQPTGFGSNNPFAPASPAPPMPSFSSQPSNASPAPSSAPSFNLQGTYANSSAPSFTSPSPSTSSPAPRPPSGASNTPSIGRQPNRADQEHAKLAGLFENREGGQDTFGNIGQLRYVFLLSRLILILNLCPLGMATPMLDVLSLRRLATTPSNSNNSNSRVPTNHSSLSELDIADWGSGLFKHYHLPLFHVYFLYTLLNAWLSFFSYSTSPVPYGPSAVLYPLQAFMLFRLPVIPALVEFHLLSLSSEPVRKPSSYCKS